MHLLQKPLPGPSNAVQTPGLQTSVPGREVVPSRRKLLSMLCAVPATKNSTWSVQRAVLGVSTVT